MRSFREERGAAILMVVIVLAALTIVGAPFALSMHLHMRASRGFKCRTQARLAAEGALAHAVAQLRKTSDASERADDAMAPFNTPEYDTRDELDIDFSFAHDPKLAAKVKSLGLSFTETVEGVLWSVEVEDEQGKVNLVAAPPALIGNLLGSSTLTERIDSSATEIPVSETYYFPRDDDDNTVDGRIRIGGEVMSYSGVDDYALIGVQRSEYASPHRKGELVYLAGGEAISNLRARRGALQDRPFRTVFEAKEVIPPQEFERVERFVTVHSHRESGTGWVRRENIVGGRITTEGRTIRVKDNSNYGPGTYVRFMDGDEPLAYGRVDAAGYSRRGGGRAWFHLEEEIGLDISSDELCVEAELRHPINVNTAPRRVLVGMFKGVRNRRSSDSVSGEEAELLADRFIEGDITNEDDFRAVLDEARNAGDISWNDRKALLENATVPNSTNLSLSTTTVCYKTYGTYTIEASGIVSNPVGNELGRYTVREIISIPEESPGTIEVRSQREFEDQMKAGFGRKVVTWPNPMIEANTAPDESVEDDDGVVRLGTSEVGMESTGRAWIDHFRSKRNGCTLFPDGGYLTGTLSYDKGVAFQFTNGLCEPGYFEMWCRPRRMGGDPIYFFDVGEANYRNRVAFYYDPGMREIVLAVADTCREGKIAEYKYPFDMELNEWYHVAAAWKGTQYGQQSIRVDGQAWGDGRCVYKPSTRLMGDLSETDTTVLVEDTDGFPQWGAVQIDEEIIEYQATTGGSFEGCRRGTRYSSFATHRTDAVVRPYGYSNGLAEDLYTGGATVQSEMGRNANARIKKPAAPPAEPLAGIDDIETTIPVDDASQLQDSGFVRIGNEIVYFGSRTDTELRGCIRGARGTEAVEHRYRGARGPQVSQISLHVSATESYPRTGHLSIMDPPEWIEYQNKVSMEGKNYFMPWYRVYKVGGVQRLDVGGFRSRFGTPRQTLLAGEPIMPVFRVRGPQCGDKNSPDGEVVTLADRSDKTPVLKTISHAHAAFGENRRRDPRTGRWIHVNWWHAFYVSLRSNVGRRISSNGGRLLKFPSGELPSKLPGRVYVGSAKGGRYPMRGYIDEVKFTKKTCKSGYILRDHGITATDDQIIVVPHGGGANFPNTGVVKIGDEFIHYDGTRTGRITISRGPRSDRMKKRDRDSGTAGINVVYLNNCIRGILGGGRADMQAEGSPVTFCDEYPVTTLAGAMMPATDVVHVNDSRLFPAEGYALVDTEIFSWTKRSRGGSLEGCELFRGAFGTPAGSHAPGRIVQSLPFRYWDRYAPEADSPDMAYFQVATTVRDAIWQSISWDETAPDAPGAGAPLLVRCVVRFDGAPGWDSKPKNEPGELWEFTREGVHNFAARRARRMGIKADQVEARFYFDYRSGCFGRGRDYWKRTSLVDSVQLTYSSPLVVRKYDVIDY